MDANNDDDDKNPRILCEDSEETAPSTLPEPDPDQLAEYYSSTIDPSHVIHLIRQLLPVKTATPDCPISVASAADLQLPETPPNGNRQEPRELESTECSVVSEGTGDPGVVDDAKGCSREESDHSKEEPHARDNNGAEDSGGADFREEKDFPGVEARQEGGANEKPALCEQDELREEAGCVLWDLAANESQAEFLVENRILEVLVAILCLPQSDRMREICLGILGNLACHSKPVKVLVNFEGLVQTVIQQLQFEDPPSLCETCRLLSAGLHNDAASAWVHALQQEEVLERIMWIAANTMNSQLREKSTELLLAIVDSKQEAFCALLPILLRMRLPELLTDLIECEVAAITEGTSTCGDAVLDIVLQIAEALSLFDEFATRLASSQKLFSLACQVIRLSHKDEIGPSGITGTVLIANLLTEKNSLIRDFLQDGTMVTHLLGLLPTVSEDSGARNALWSILQRVCQHLQQARQLEMSSDEEASLMAAVADGSNLLLDDLDDHRDDDEQEDVVVRASSGVTPSCGRQAKLATIVNVVHLMDDWLASDPPQTGNRGAEVVGTVQNACELLGNYSASPDSVMHDQVLGR